MPDTPALDAAVRRFPRLLRVVRMYGADSLPAIAAALTDRLGVVDEYHRICAKERG